jgi:hypothetical protein
MSLLVSMFCLFSVEQPGEAFCLHSRDGSADLVAYLGTADLRSVRGKILVIGNEER